MLGEGEKVFSRFTWHGTQRSEFFGVPATGKQITVKGVVVDHVAGKMVESQILVVVKGSALERTIKDENEGHEQCDRETLTAKRHRASR